MSKPLMMTEDDWIKGMTMQPVPYEVPGWGWIEVRGLTAAETREILTVHKTLADQKIASVVAGVVRPTLSEAAIEATKNGHPGRIIDIADRIWELSGLGEKSKQDPLAGSGSSPS